ncbi:hypothetical protein PTKIN_Ptkin16aG0114000 [Pterospermum kingtungense]
MPLETSKPEQYSTGEGGKHRQLDREIKDMVSAITHPLSVLHKPGSTHLEDDDDEQGVRIIALTGNNAGATMRSELDEKSYGISLGEAEAAAILSTYVNSNSQSVNNSIMLSSSYNTNDPGVHLDVYEHEGQKPVDKPSRTGKTEEISS